MKNNKSHGMSNKPGTREFRTYRAWQMMKQRCTNPKTNRFERYGGAGVAYHPTWESFEVFLSDVGLAPTSKHTIDRIHGSLDYMPGNVRWATRKEQQNNLKSNHWITFNGVTKNCQGWAHHLGTSRQSFGMSIKRRGEQGAIQYYLSKRAA